MEEQFCLPFPHYCSAFVFVPVGHALEVPVQSSPHVSSLLRVRVKDLCQVPDRLKGWDQILLFQGVMYFLSSLLFLRLVVHYKGELLAVKATPGMESTFTHNSLSEHAGDGSPGILHRRV